MGVTQLSIILQEWQNSRSRSETKRVGNSRRCPVQPKVAKSRVRLQVISRGPDLGGESLPGAGTARANASKEARTPQAWWGLAARTGLRRCECGACGCRPR